MSSVHYLCYNLMENVSSGAWLWACEWETESETILFSVAEGEIRKVAEI